MLPRTIALLCIAIALVMDMDAREPRKLRLPWSGRDYSEQPLPAVWRDVTTERQTEVAPYEAFTLRDSPLSVKAFVGRFGPPSRYLVSKRPGYSRFLVYDLPSGHAVGIYVYDPPTDVFAAIVIFDPRGELVKLIK